MKTACCLAACLALAGCGKKFNPASGAASPAQVVETGNAGLVTVDNPEQFPLVAAGRIDEPDKLNVTGSVFPDISREVPVISLANGRVVDIRARLDDNVKKGQLLFSVQSPDISNAFDTYLKAVNDEQLANKAYIRAKDLLPARRHFAGHAGAGRGCGEGRQGRPGGGRSAVEDPRRRQGPSQPAW